MILSKIFDELDVMALVVAPVGAEKALNAIINSFRNLDKMQINNDRHLDFIWLNVNLS
jgi:hypothetical protein